MFKKIIKPLASIKLAVFVILLIAGVSAVGTFYESMVGEAYAAQKVVYKSVYMYLAIFLLCVNLIAVMIDRWPWKVRHTGFVCAHIGILITLFGAWITQEFGVDGSVAIEVGDKGSMVVLPDRQISLYAFDENMVPKVIGQKPTDFIVDLPSSDQALFQIEGKPLRVKQYFHFAERDEKIVASENKNDGPAIRFLLSNDNVSVSEWMFASKSNQQQKLELGPATVVWDYGEYKYSSGNVIHLFPKEGKVAYRVYSKKKKGLSLEGLTEAGSMVATGWMGLELRLLNFYPHSRRRVTYVEKERFSKATQSAVQFEYDGEEYWLGLNSIVRFFSKSKAYVLSYGQVQIPLGFNVYLKKFNVGRYQGTKRASSYASDVFVKDLGFSTISMNNPLKHNGFTLYQASFSENESGQPTASVLSVNKDPGRWWKYLGCLIMVFGICHLFFYKKWIGKRKKGVRAS